MPRSIATRRSRSGARTACPLDVARSLTRGDSVTYTFPVDGWPASSPYDPAVGGAQLQYGWRWNPQTDVAFNADGELQPGVLAVRGNTMPLNVVWNESWTTVCP